MIPCNKFTKAGQRCKRLFSVAWGNRMRLAFMSFPLQCTMGAKGTHVSPIRYKEILKHICKHLHGFISIFVGAKLTAEPEKHMAAGFNLLKIKDNSWFPGMLLARQDCSLMAYQLHILGRVGFYCHPVARWL